MIINEKIFKIIMDELGLFFSKKIIIEVMDEFLYMSDERFSEKTKFNSCLQLFINEIHKTYGSSEKFIYNGYVGERFIANCVDIACQTGVYVSALSFNKIQLDAMNYAINTVIPDRIIFINTMKTENAINIVMKRIEHHYKKIIAGHLIALNEEACKKHNINEIVAMKNDCDAFIQNTHAYPELKDCIIYNISPEDLYSGKYDYLKNASYKGCF